ncbi:hypothetical protein GWK16_08305 [Roseomonas sp. JC162]|uniref:Lipoprotein n=1 Tax=Neoroseomonas marina TaxID=1232220 RepID=A0A848ED59_9PROT|nr:hypothetical protein [Neoroseomonas marina]NMJ41238.1 hypothetical protein [Neoroseomonas marina]
MVAARAALLLPFLVLACAEGPDEEAVAAMHQAFSTARASIAAVPPSAPSPAAAPPPPVVPNLPVTQHAAPRLRGAGAPAAAAALLGARAEDMRRMLGEPSLRRPEGEAEIWLYEGADCRLDVVLYPERGAMVVAHAAARAQGGAAVTEAACLASIATYPGAARRT